MHSVVPSNSRFEFVGHVDGEVTARTRERRGNGVKTRSKKAERARAEVKSWRSWLFAHWIVFSLGGAGKSSMVLDGKCSGPDGLEQDGDGLILGAGGQDSDLNHGTLLSFTGSFYPCMLQLFLVLVAVAALASFLLLLGASWWRVASGDLLRAEKGKRKREEETTTKQKAEGESQLRKGGFWVAMGSTNFLRVRVDFEFWGYE